MKLYKNIYKKLNIPLDSVVFDLLKVPGDKGELHHQAYDEDAVQQADLLFLPNDNGYKYALVCVDVATRKTDAEPIKDKQPKTVLKALKKIWKRKYVNRPTVFFKTDDGSEFKGVVEQYFEDNGIIRMVGKAGRSRSQSVVEAVNLMLGKAIAVKHRNDELADDEYTDDWVDDIPIIIKEYNKFIQERTEERKRISKKSRKKIMYEEMNVAAEMPAYQVGDLVHIPLDKPTNLKGDRLNGKFRAGDLRRETKPRKITDVLIGDPTVYKVDGLKTAVYTKEMLIPDTKKGKPKGTKKKYVVEKILKRRKRNNKIELLIKWEGYGASENTWALRSELMKQIPDLVREFERDN